MSTEKVNVSLSKDEALVLFEFLSRFSGTDKLSIEDRAEERALWNLTSAFEEALTEPFSDNYSAILSSARERLRDRNE